MDIRGLADSEISVASITVLSASLADDGGPLPGVRCSLVVKDSSVNDLSRQPNDLQQWASTSIAKVKSMLNVGCITVLSWLQNKPAEYDIPTMPFSLKERTKTFLCKGL